MPSYMTLLFALPAALLWTSAKAESLADLLEKAIYTETTAGNVDQAISLYEKIIATSDANRVTVAQAHFRRGLCLLKKGDQAGATEEFETIKARFSDQRDVVAASNRELRKLGATPAVAGCAVLRTTPEALSDAVPATLTELTVTFNQKMMDGTWSWTGGGETFPKMTGKPAYDSAGKTCTMPVTLEPGKVYWVGINSPSHQNFKSASGQPAQRYVILFATASADGKPTPIPQEMLDRAKEVNARVRATRPAGASTGPRVLKTVPPALENAVSPTLTEMSVTFDQPMADGSWSWTGGGETFPQMEKPHYDASRQTCTLPVKLEPGKVYWVGINSPSHKNFKSATGQPAQRYAILFATAGADGKPTPIPQEMLTQAKAINAQPSPGSSAGEADPAMSLLDAATRAEIERFEQGFAAFFQKESAYEAASADERSKMVDVWKTAAKSQDLQNRVRAIAGLGNVRAKEAVKTLMEIADEPMNNNRPKWMAVRALGRIGDPSAVPVLIELVDHGNTNVRVYSRLALAQITKQYFGEDKAKWRAWWKEHSAGVK